MNRRDFTLLLGASIAQLAIPKQSQAIHILANTEMKRLNEIRAFWSTNFNLTPEKFIAQNNITEKNFNSANKLALKNEDILKFKGMYFSHCELALLASLAPITV